MKWQPSVSFSLYDDKIFGYLYDMEPLLPSTFSDHKRNHHAALLTLDDDPVHPSVFHRRAKIFFSIMVCGFTLLIIAFSVLESLHSFTPQAGDGDIVGKNAHNVNNGDFHHPALQSESVNETILRGISNGVSSKSNLNVLFGRREVEDYPWNDIMLSWQRTAFHFQPENNWMNDPNGPFYYKGWYHFFYQYNPKAAVWGDIVWGHAVSEDLINWLHLPLAMVPDQWYDINGVWTGSATILPDGSIIMLYTGSTNGSVQVQNLAYPADLNDPLLLGWIKFNGNPVLFPPPGIGLQDFRDPSTAWKTSKGSWRITIGSVVGTSGVAFIYETEDFRNFTKLPSPLHGVANTGMWECVDFFPVSTENSLGLETSMNGPGVKHVVKASLDDHRFDYYAIGTYFEDNCSWIPDNPEIDVGKGIRYDYGLFYASKSFYDPKKQRRILWGWIPESDSETVDVKKGWASVQGIPRTVSLDLKTGSNLLQSPVEEVESLRSNWVGYKNLTLNPGSVIPLDLESATQLDIVAEFELSNTTVEYEEEYSCDPSCGAARRGGLGPFGLLILADENRTEQTPAYFYLARGGDGILKTFFCVDGLRSSVADDVNKDVYGSFVPVLSGEKLSVRILVDHSVIESFVQGGRTSVASRVYPTRAIHRDARLFFFNNATQAEVVASVDIWQMNSAKIRLSSSG